MWVLPTSLCSPVSAELSLDLDSLCQLYERSLTWRGKPTAAKSWRRAWKKNASLQRLSGRTLPPSTAVPGVASWIASLAASRARTFLTQASEPGSAVSAADCGSSTSDSFAKWDQPSCSWRTSQLSYNGDLAPYSGRWPNSGLMRNGTCSQRPKSEHHTSESGYSFWPTTTVADSASTCNSTATRHKLPPTGVHVGNTLTDAIRLWPTAV